MDKIPAKTLIVRIIIFGTLLSLVLIIIISLFITFFSLAHQNKNNAQLTMSATPVPQSSINEVLLYAVNGKIKKIDGAKIIIESLTTDSVVSSTGKKELETRELNITGDTKFYKLTFIPRKSSVVMPDNPTADSFGSLSSFAPNIAESSAIDLKIGDNILAESKIEISRIRNFSPKSITILPYAVY